MDNSSWTTAYPDGKCTGCNISTDHESLTQPEQLGPAGDFSIFDTWIKAVNICIGLVGVSGNTLVIVVILASVRMRANHTNYYILNQSVLDFCSGLFLILQSVIESDGRYFVTLADDLYCRIWLAKFPLWSASIGSSYSLIALTIDRYLAVVHPIWHRNYFRRRGVLAVSVTTSWLCGFVSMAAYMFPSSGIENGKCMLFHYFSSARAQKMWSIAFIIWPFFLPMSVHIFCYVRMARVIWKSTNVVVQPVVQLADSTNNNNHKTRVGRNVIMTLAVVTLCFCFCWVTNQISWMGFQFGWFALDLNGVIYQTSVFLVFCNCCVNPFIYVFKYTQFQKEMRSLFCPRRGTLVETGTSRANTG